MPEIPDLEIVTQVVRRHILGARIEQVRELRPLAVRTLAAGESPNSFLEGQVVEAVERRGKFLFLRLSGERWVAINPMLAGRMRFCAPAGRPLVRDYLALRFSTGEELRYHDLEGMGKVYLTRELAQVPGLAEQGPDALDPALTEEAFRERLRPFRGEIKGVLTRGHAVSGIGNAYSDEILFAAGIYPFRKRTSLSTAELSALYSAMRRVLTEAIAVVRVRVGENIQDEVRDFLQVHNKKGQPCPRCGQAISEVKVAQRATDFCRRCQPGTLVRN